MTTELLVAAILAIVCSVLLEGSSGVVVRLLMTFASFVAYPSRYRCGCDRCITNRIERGERRRETEDGDYAKAKTNIGLIHVGAALGFVNKSAVELLTRSTVDNVAFLGTLRIVTEAVVMPVANAFRAMLTVATVAVVLHPDRPTGETATWTIFGVTAVLGLTLDIWTARELRRGRKRALVGVLTGCMTLPGVPAYWLLKMNQAWHCTGPYLLVCCALTSWAGWTMISTMRIQKLEAGMTDL